MRRILISILLLIALLGQCFAETAHEAPVPTKVESFGFEGVVWRSPGKGRALLPELNLTRVEGNKALVQKNETVELTVEATGGDGRYQYMFALCSKDPDNFDLDVLKWQGKSTDNSYKVMVDSPGLYVLVIWLYDGSGASLEYHCHEMECAAARDYFRPDTVAGKVAALAQQCMEEAGSSDYARALWLHDWLIYNANYDHSYKYYFADGVLLRGTGVCNSYTLAYQMLLDELDIENMYIFSGDRKHCWNLLKLGGEWYHVDCTWDDPGAGGKENHAYFCLTDEQMALDHEWSSGKLHIPECDAEEYNFTLRTVPVARSREDVYSLLADMARRRVPWMEFLNETGADVDVWDVWYDVVDDMNVRYTAKNCSSWHYGKVYYVSVDYGAGYPAGLQASSLCIEEESLLLDAGESHKLLLLCSPGMVYRDGGSGKLEWMSAKAQDFEAEWSSSDASIAAVENGRVHARASGLAYISVRSGSVSDTIPVLVAGEPAGMQVSIPSSARQVGEEAFLDCTDIQRIVFEEDCSLSIGARAFAGCTGVDFVYIPTGVQQIGEGAFDGCGAVMLCAEDSAAHHYALQNDMPYFLMESYLL